MSDQFRMGRLTARQADTLNEILQSAKDFKKLTVAAPLMLTRNAGIPVISVRQNDEYLAEITETDGGTPPVYTAKRKTRDTDNTIIDYVPELLYDRVLSPDTGITFDVGDLVVLVPIVDYPGYYWATLLSSAGRGFFARLTSSSSGKWKWVALTLNSGGVYVDDGTESATYSAVPLTIDGTNYAAAPVSGMRVWMIPSKQDDLFEFMPIGKSTSPTGCTGDTGWVHGLLETEAMYMEVLFSGGTCAGIATDQTAYMRWDAGESKWVSQEWDCGGGAWVDKDFVTDTNSSPLKFWIDAGRPRLQLSGITYDLGYVCGGAGSIVFAGGTDTVCSGVTPVQCENYFQVQLTCMCDPIDGWQGEGWYCITDAGGDCELDTLEVVYLDDPCVTDILICSCKFDTELEALAACVPPTPSCCSDAIPDDLYLHLSATGGCANLNGMVIHLQRNVMVSTTTWNFLSATGGTGGCVSANITIANFVCTTGVLTLVFGADNTAATTLLTFACSPFLATYDLTFTFSIDETCCSGTATATLNTTP